MPVLPPFDSSLYLNCAPQVEVSTLRAVVQHESRGNPLAIHVNGPRQLVRQPSNQAEAIATAEALQAAGYSFDVGLGQINNKNFPRLALSVETAFDPCANLHAASVLLVEAYRHAIDQHADAGNAVLFALSAYNTGSLTAGFSNGYVAHVVDTAWTLSHEAVRKP